MSTRSVRPHAVRRQGFTLSEILIALTIVAIIGAAMVRLILIQAKFSEQQMGLRNARTVSRNAMNIMLTDLRMVQDSGGLVAATRDSVTVRVPVAFGLLCSAVGNGVISLLPVDSSMMALGRYHGWAYRDSVTETYQYSDAATPAMFNMLATPPATTCTDSTAGPGILGITYGSRATRVVLVPDPPVGVPTPGWPAFIYQNVTYRFRASTTFPNRIGLFRILKMSGASTAGMVIDEIIAPFDTAAKFRFYVLNADTAQSDPPADLKQVRGLQLVLAGASPRLAPGETMPKQAQLVTGVFFKNRRDP